MNNLQMNVQTLNSLNVDGYRASASPRRPLGMTLAFGLSSILLTACGGGSADGGSADATAAVKIAVPITTVKVVPTVPPTVFTPTAPSAPAAPLPVGNAITDVKIQNTAAAQTNVPFTFGQVFAVGALQPTEGLVSKLQDGTALRLQMDVKATHADGSVRHAVISGVLPALAAGQVQTLELAKSSVTEQSTVTPQSVVDAGLTGSISIKLDNVQYSASLATP